MVARRRAAASDTDLAPPVARWVEGGRGGEVELLKVTRPIYEVKLKMMKGQGPTGRGRPL